MKHDKINICDCGSGLEILGHITTRWGTSTCCKECHTNFPIERSFVPYDPQGSWDLPQEKKLAKRASK